MLKTTTLLKHNMSDEKLISTYSSLPNNRGASNKSMVAYNFLGLLLKNARFWSFLA